MKRTTLIVSMFMVSLLTIGQNLVPNYSFEDTLKCINNGGEFNGYVKNWLGQASYGGLWYFTSQCNSEASVPYNYVGPYPMGFQYAHSGVSYAGIVTFANGGSDTTFPYSGNFYKDQRNYIEAQFTNSLKNGITYYVTFFTSRANYWEYSCSDIGAYISDSALSFKGNLSKTYITPQIANNPKIRELDDTLNWMKISGSYLAHGGEQYIIIGNFKNDSNSII